MADINKQMASMLPAADTDTRSTEQYLKETQPLTPKSVPFFQRSMDMSPDDKPTGRYDEDGNMEYKTALGRTYFVKPAADQRTTRDKIVQDVIPAAKEYIEDPSLPSAEQVKGFTKGVASSVWDTMSIPKQLATGEKSAADVSMEDIFGTTVKTGTASAMFNVPKDAIRSFGGVSMEGASKDKNLKKAIKLAQKAGVENIGAIPEDVNRSIWEKTGWFVDPNDGQWRLHFSDYKSEMKPFNKVFKTETVDFNTLKNYPLSREEGKKTVLSNVLSHDDLFNRYPAFKDVDVTFYSAPNNKRHQGYARYTGSETGEIGINLAAFDSFDSVRGTLLHEVQHLIQNKEGFVPGASSSNIPFNLIEDYSKSIKNKIDPLQEEVTALKDKLSITDDKTERMEIFSKIDTLMNKIYDYKMQDYNTEYQFYRGAGGEIESRLVDVLKDIPHAQEYYPLNFRDNMLEMEGLSPDFIGKKGVDPLVYKQQERRVPEREEPTGIMQRVKGALGFNEVESIVPQMSNEEYDTLFKALDEVDNPTDWQKGAKAIIKNGRVANPGIKTPELEDSTRLLLENKITREEHLANVDKYKPVNAWDALPREPSDKALVFALDSGKRDNGLFVLDAATAEALGVPQSSLAVGMKFNGRLDIPAYLHNDTWIVAGTSPSVKTADNRGVTNYAKAIHYVSDGDTPVKFVASEKSSASIGSGEKDKWGYATVSGIVGDLDANAIRAKAEQYLNDPEWTQVGFDPRRQGGFYVRAGKNKHVPVREASEVIQIGPLVLARNAKLDFEYSGYNEGGLAMDEQTKAVFKSSRGYAEGGEVETAMMEEGIDPVSGIVGDLDANAIRAKAEQYLNDPEWTQVGFDPRRQGGFYVRAGENKHVPVREASEVIQIGPLVLARNAKLDFEYSGYNEGGLAMDEQTKAVFKSSRGYAEGGEVETSMMEEGIDPVSGNEVPTGSLPEEVRDDIPAQLSEGEYVVPSDVVRYYGVKFFEDLRNQAKMGWSEMEANGRVGGEPVSPEGMEMGDEDFPFSLEELQVMDTGEEQPQMALGGFISGYSNGGDVDINAIAKEFPGTIVGTGNNGEEYKTYVNEKGMTITIRFVNGKPVTAVPPGYKEASSAQEVVAPKQNTSNDNEPATPQKQPESVDWEKADPQKFREVLDTQFSKIGKAVPTAIGLMNPLIGTGISLATSMQNKRMLAALDKRLESADPNSTEFNELSSIRKDLLKNVDRNNDGKVDTIVERSGIFGGESSWDKNLKDTDGIKGASFGDTWLGDLLGFDKEGFGVQGPRLKASLGGARRSNSDKNRGTESNAVVGNNDTGRNSFLQSAANFFTPNDGKSYQGGKLVEDKKENKDTK